MPLSLVELEMEDGFGGRNDFATCAAAAAVVVLMLTSLAYLIPAR